MTESKNISELETDSQKNFIIFNIYWTEKGCVSSEVQLSKSKDTCKSSSWPFWHYAPDTLCFLEEPNG